MTVHIRAATPDDLAAVVAIQNAVSPDNLVSLATFQARERGRRPDLLFGRLVAEQGGRVVGSANYGHFEWLYDPRKFLIGAAVRPEAQGQGIGRALYGALRRVLAAHDPVKLTAYTAESRPRAMRFLQARGFTEAAREQESALQLAGADLSGLENAVRHIAAQGYQIRTFAELEDDPEREAKFYALDLDASRDVPMPPGEQMTSPSLERYWESVRGNPHFDPALWFVAVRGGEYAGLSELLHTDTPGVLNTGFTGVARAHRRRGLALALKLRALTHARQLSAREVRTENDATNAPMLGINIALGFQKRPAWLNYAFDLG